MRVFWDTSEAVYGFRQSMLVCAYGMRESDGTWSLGLCDGLGHPLLVAHEGAKESFLDMSRYLNGAHFVVAYGLESILVKLKSMGAPVYVPHATDLREEEALAFPSDRKGRSHSLSRLCARLGLGPVRRDPMDGAWMTAACVDALLGRAGYLTNKAKHTVCSLREVELYTGGIGDLWRRPARGMEAIMASGGRRNDARLIRKHGNYHCYVGGRYVGMAACETNVRDLFSLAEYEEAPETVQCSVRLVPGEGRRSCVATLTGKSPLLEQVLACSHITEMGSFAPRPDFEEETADARSLRLVDTQRSSAPQPAQSIARIGG